MKKTSVVLLLSFLVLLASAIYSLVVPDRDTVFTRFENQQVITEGVVVRAVDERESHKRVTLRAETIAGYAVPKGNPLLLVSVDRYVDVSYGDRVVIEGRIQRPESFETDTGRTFNYHKYLSAHHISHTISFARVTHISHDSGNPIVATLLKVKEFFITGIERALPEPHGALAKGLLLGEKQSLGGALTDAFRVSGLVHIIVLSGYNVALVINAVLFVVLRFFPRVMAYVCAGIFVVGFVIITGGSETTLRAAIMALFMMMARVLHRPADALNGLAIAAAAMALWNPMLVLYDLSFQLSVFATLGLILFSSGIAKRLTFITEKLGFREIVATTLATQITVLPLLVYSIGAVSLVFLPANALVLPAVPVAMLFSFFAGLLSLMVPGLSVLWGVFAYVTLEYIIGVSQFFGTLPHASVIIPSVLLIPTLVGLLLVYGVVATSVMRRTVLK